MEWMPDEVSSNLPSLLASKWRVVASCRLGKHQFLGTYCIEGTTGTTITVTSSIDNLKDLIFVVKASSFRIRGRSHSQSKCSKPSIYGKAAFARSIR